MKNWHALRLATLQIYYYMPDHRDLVQEFLWQTEDYVPEFPRIHKFLLHWQQNIEATIQTVNVSYTDPFQKTRYIKVDQIYKL